MAGDIERGQRIKARREELHLTQPAVVELMEDAARDLPEEHLLHPKTARKAPVTLRGYQTYEKGGGINWDKAKLLAQALRMDVTEMMLGEPEPERTPEMFPPRPVSLAGMQGAILEAIMDQLAMQTAVLKEIKWLLQRENAAATAFEEVTERVDVAARRFETLSAEAAQAIRTQRAPEGGPPRRRATPKEPAPKRTPKAAGQGSP